LGGRHAGFDKIEIQWQLAAMSSKGAMQVQVH